MEEVIKAIKVDPIPDGRRVRRYLLVFLGVLMVCVAALGAFTSHRRSMDALRERELTRLAGITSSLVQGEPAEELVPERRALEFQERWAVFQRADAKIFAQLRDREGKVWFDSRFADQPAELVFVIPSYEGAEPALDELKLWSGTLRDEEGQEFLVSAARTPSSLTLIVGREAEEFARDGEKDLNSSFRWAMAFALLLLPLTIVVTALVASGPRRRA